jgi:hypothetical protein
MARFGRDSNRDYDYAYGPWRGEPEYSPRFARAPAYDRDYGVGRRPFPNYREGAARDYRVSYDDAYGPPPYGHRFKSRWETNYGDPFGDRVRQPPMRVIRGTPGRFARRPTGYDHGYGSYPYGRGFGSPAYGADYRDMERHLRGGASQLWF